jgi:iron complex outermembrane recepter protein
MGKSICVVGMGFLVLAGMTANDLAAQQPVDRDSVIPLRPVSVTVLRTPLRMDEVPYAVSVNGVNEIQMGKPGLSVEEGLRTIPGVQVDNRHNYALGERISIRGFGARAQFGVRGVRVFLDGIPATLPDGQSSLTNVDVKTLGRVEVVRGPAASLYGNTAGGVIQMEMQQPPPVPFSQEFGVIGGSDGMLRLSSSTGGVADGAAYQLNFTRFETEGYRQHSAARNLYLNGRLGFDSERDRVRVIVSVGDTDAQNPGSLSEALQEQDRFQAFTNNILFQTGKTVQEGTIGASWARDVAPGSFEFAGYLVQRDVVNPIPQDIIDLHRVGGGTRGLFRSNPLGALGVQLSVGAELDRQEDDRREYANVDGEQGDLQLDQLERVDNLGLFAQLAAHPASRLTVLGGLRYDWFEFKADDRFFGNGDPDDSGSRTLDAISPSVGLTFAVTDDAQLYGNVGKTFETPTTVELGNRADGAGGLNPNLEPQEATSYEIGGRTLLAQRLALQLAAYYADVTNSLIPFQVPDAPGRDYFQNAGSATHRGIEFGATAVPVDGLSVQVAYTLTDAKYDNFLDRNGNQHAGNDVPGVAPQRAEAVVTVAPGGFPGFVALENRYVSKIAANDGNTAFSPAYTLTDLRAGFNDLRLGQVTLSPFGGITNIFDKDYNTSVAINAFGGRFFESGPGRSFYFGGNLRVERR